MTNTNLNRDLAEAIEALGQNLLASEPLTVFEQRHARLAADSEAAALMRNLMQTEASLRARQSNGGLEQADITQYRALQAEVQANEVIADYMRVQNDAVAYLQQINQEISQLLGVDFAALARRPNSCCG